MRRRPILAAVFCAACQFFLTIIILKAGIAFVPPESFGKVRLAAFASTIVLPILLAQIFHVWRDVGLRFDTIKPVSVFFVSLLPAALFLSMGVHSQEHGSFVTESLMQFVNAFGEELLFRGVIFALLLGLPAWQVIVLPAVLFGSMHLIHAFMDASPSASLAQAAITTISGMMFAAVRYATGSLWLTIFVHAILNLSIIYSNVEFAAGATALLLVRRLANVVEFALACYVMVRRSDTAT